MGNQPDLGPDRGVIQLARSHGGQRLVRGQRKLEVDEEAKSLGTPFDSPEFIPKATSALRDEKTKTAAAMVLGRYAPDGPGANAGAEAWAKWWQENSPYLFYSELGCYRWYVDPLAKKRGVPTKELRGAKRADNRGRI